MSNSNLVYSFVKLSRISMNTWLGICSDSKRVQRRASKVVAKFWVRGTAVICMCSTVHNYVIVIIITSKEECCMPIVSNICLELTSILFTNVLQIVWEKLAA